MDVTIKELSLALREAYLDFFDHRAFSDGNPNGPCYCTSPNMDRGTEEKMIGEFGDDIKGTIRRYAVAMLTEEKIHGYLAFDGDVSIGWCNAADRDNYSSFVPEIARRMSCGKTFSIVCFEIDPRYRGKGIATALLNRACNDAKEKGYRAVEGYPMFQSERSYHSYKGPIQLYERAGFSEIAREGNQIVMRKLL